MSFGSNRQAPGAGLERVGLGSSVEVTGSLRGGTTIVAAGSSCCRRVSMARCGWRLGGPGQRGSVRVNGSEGARERGRASGEGLEVCPAA